MCLAFPGKVISINGRQAQIQYPDEVRTVYMSDTQVEVGDFALVQMGIIINKLTRKEALTSLKAWGFKNVSNL